MHHRTVEDLMSRPVVRARPDTTFKDIVTMLAENDVTAVPVVDERDCPVGMVSEADLIQHEAALADPGGHLTARRMLPGDRDRARAETAQGLMRSPVITARGQWSVVEAARTMDRHKVKRLPVVDESGRLVGIVSRGDLLRVFLRHDAAIHEEIIRDVLRDTLSITPDIVRADVSGGVVTLTGTVSRKSLIPIVEGLCQAVDGVVAVHSNLAYALDDEPAGSERPNVHGVVGYTQHP